MRKLLLLLFGVFMFSTNFYAWDQISFTVTFDDEQGLGHGYPKSPVEPPIVYIESDTLMFEAAHPEYILIIKDEDDGIVYSTAVYSSETQIVLPSSLSGNYEIELIMGNWIFTGYVSL